MTKNTSISYIIPAYNCENTLKEAIQSIYQDNFFEEDEVVIINDCSTDRTGEIIDELIGSYPDIKRIDHLVNKGTAAASRNTGIEHIKNELIFCLDSDNVLVPGSIENLKNHLINTNADAAAFGELHHFTESIKEISHKWIYNDEITLADALCGHFWPGPSGNYLFTRESWLKAGRYFEPTLENQTLDSWTFGIRQLGTGSKMVTLKNSWYFHRYGHNSHYVRNKEIGNQSLTALIGIIPFLHLIEEEDVDFIFSKKERTQWYQNLNNRPINVKGGYLTKKGYIQMTAPGKERMKSRRSLSKIIVRIIKKHFSFIAKLIQRK